MSTTSPPPSANPPETPPSTSSPPPQSPPPAVPAAPPTSTVSPPPVASSPPPTTSISPPPQQTVSPPPSNNSPPPPTHSASPPPPSATPPQSPPSPPPPSTPPKASPPPPPPASEPPANSPPPPILNPPANSPPPPQPPTSSPPPPSSQPPQTTPPPPASNPPQNSPPPPATKSPEGSPPPPSSKPPASSPPPPPSSKPPASSPPPPPSSKPPASSPPPPPSKPPASSPPPPASKPPGSSPSPPSDPPTPGKSPPPLSQPSPPNSSPPPPIIRSSAPSSSDSPPSPSVSVIPSFTKNNNTNITAIASISAAVGILVISLIGLLIWCIAKRNRNRKRSGLKNGYVMPSPNGSSPNSDTSFLNTHSSAPGSGSVFLSSPIDPSGRGNSRPLYTYEELVVATNGFSTQNLLGEGGFGSVYKGCLQDGREVAVKQLKIGGGQGEREFKAEVEIISRIHHRHLVTLVGYCIADNRRLLIYEYVPNDTLHFHLHGQDQPVMDWVRRVKIAAGAARGIAYLHEDCHPRIIHRDIKSSNILLDTNFEAQVSDFGLAKLAMDADTHLTTRVMGTFGYMAPEYASTGKLTEKSDVYSFGVVLLELITGRKSVDLSQSMGDESLVEWARPLLTDAIASEQFDSIADPRLENNYIKSEMFQMIQAAAACIRHSAVKRPRMGQVVRALDSMVAADLTNGMKLGQSEVYNSAQQSEEIRLFRRMAFGNQNYSTEYFSQSIQDS